jgi:hypothetical protein
VERERENVLGCVLSDHRGEIAVEIKTQAVQIINTGVWGWQSLSMEEIIEKRVCKVACLK